MLWDLIRDFFVKYIFGGQTSDGHWFDGFFGNVTIYVDGSYDDNFLASVNDIFYPIGSNPEQMFTIGVGDYLSLLATIITMVFIIILTVKLVMFCFNIFRRVID